MLVLVCAYCSARADLCDSGPESCEVLFMKIAQQKTALAEHVLTQSFVCCTFSDSNSGDDDDVFLSPTSDLDTGVVDCEPMSDTRTTDDDVSTVCVCACCLLYHLSMCCCHQFVVSAVRSFIHHLLR